MPTRKVLEYLEQDGSSPFAKWFMRLDPVAGAKVTTALYRMEQGNLSSVKPVGQGVAEYRIDFGPGYRIYIGQHGEVLIILLGWRHQERPEFGYSARSTTLARI
jgi:putative addiction module killer protein